MYRTGRAEIGGWHGTSFIRSTETQIVMGPTMKIQRREAQTTSSPYFSVKSVARVTIIIKNEVDANVPRGTVGVRRTKSSRLYNLTL